MASGAQAETALLTEHLRYTPLTLMDEIIDTINDLANRAVDAAEKGLLQANPSELGYADKAKAEKRSLEKDERGRPNFPEAEAEMKDGVHKLETLLQANIDINFDKFEIVALRSILHVPQDLAPWMRLPHYENIPQASTNNQEIDPDALLLLRRKVRETKKLQKALQATVARNNGIIAAVKSLTAPGIEGQSQPGPLAFLANGQASEQLGVNTLLNSSASTTEPGPLETNVSFAISQLPALRTLVQELRPKLASLTDTANQPSSEGAVASERRAYVEMQSRRAIERQGVAAEIGSLDALGRVVTADELSSLEHLAEGLQNHNDVDMG